MNRGGGTLVLCKIMQKIHILIDRLIYAPIYFFVAKCISKIDYFYEQNCNSHLYQGGGRSIHTVNNDIWSYAISEIINHFIKKYEIILTHKNQFGYSLYITPDYFHAERILHFNYPGDSSPEFVFLEKIKSLGKTKFDNIFEIGVYQGYSSCFFSKISNKVFLFEPLKEMFPTIRKNLELNQLNNVELTNCAVSNYNGKAKFYKYSIKGWSSLVQHDACSLKDVSETDVITIDSFCEKNAITHVDLLSIDAEGNEYSILKGCETLLKKKM